jgi:hypothetical protein
MEVRLDSRDVVLPSRSRDALTRRIVRLFGRLGSSIRRVHITLKDVDGARRGRGKVCVLRTELTNGDQIVVIDRSVRMGRAVIRCLRRSKLLVVRELKKRRRKRQGSFRLEPAPAYC